MWETQSALTTGAFEQEVKTKKPPFQQQQVYPGFICWGEDGDRFLVGSHPQTGAAHLGQGTAPKKACRRAWQLAELLESTFRILCSLR